MLIGLCTLFISNTMFTEQEKDEVTTYKIEIYMVNLS